MSYLYKWQRQIDKKESFALIILFVFIFIIYEYILFSRFLAEKHFLKALSYLNKAHSAEKELTVSRSLFYQNALKSLNSSFNLNPLDSRSYFEYAEALVEMASEPEILNSLEIKDFGAKYEGELGFFDLARMKYTEAIMKEPTNAIYHLRLGSIYDKFSDPVKAEKELMVSALLDPQNIKIRLYLCRYFLLHDKKEIALLHLKKAVDLYKKLPRSRLSEEVENFARSFGQGGLLKK